MNEPAVTIHLHGEHHVFRPGEQLRGEYWLSHVSAEEVSAVEISVLWHTVGKGDEDLAVHWFQRVLATPERPVDPHGPGHFATELPASPLSYDGVIVKIHWTVRVRMFLAEGREVVAEREFRLGDVPPARAVLHKAPTA